MEKKIISLKEKETKILDWDGERIEVIPYISAENEISLLNVYSGIEDDDDINKYIIKKYSIITGIVDLMTNISMEGLNINNIINSGLWDEIKRNIINYEQFEQDLAGLEKSLMQKESLESKINSLIDKVSTFVDKIGNVDISKEGVSKLLEGLNVEQEKLDQILPAIKQAVPDQEKPAE